MEPGPSMSYHIQPTTHSREKDPLYNKHSFQYLSLLLLTGHTKLLTGPLQESVSLLLKFLKKVVAMAEIR